MRELATEGHRRNTESEDEFCSYFLCFFRVLLWLKNLLRNQLSVFCAVEDPRNTGWRLIRPKQPVERIAGIDAVAFLS